MKIKQYTATALCAALLVTNSGPWIPLAVAQSIVPNQGKMGPTMDEAPNGTPIVNINKPNANGLSHNQYDMFNVDDKGVILNNSRRPVSTELAGYVMGNPNLKGAAAKTILNEVTGTGATAMNGALEVAGRKAHVIIANPNGIAVNNGTFINTSAATLTTGNPIITDGTIAGYDVKQGTVTVSGQGLNASRTSRTDILAEAVQLNGKVWSDESHVVTGKNTVSVDGSGKVTNVTKTSNSEQVGLDVSQIGGMYANSMYLVGTNDGFGVNNKGILSAQNHISVDSTGKVQNSGTVVVPDISISAKGFTQVGKAKLYADSARISADAFTQTGNAVTKDAPVLIARNNLAVSTNTIKNTNGSVLKSEGVLQLGKTMDYNGAIAGKMDALTNVAATIEAGQQGVILAKSITNKNGGVTVKRAATGTTEHVKNEVAPAGSIKRYQLSEERIYGHDDPIPQDKVVVHSSENLQLSINGEHHDSWTKYEYDRTRVKEVVDTSKPGRIISGGNLQIEADVVTNDASQISAAGTLAGKIGHYEALNPKGNEYISENGTATGYSRHKHHGWDSTNIREAEYHNDIVQPIDIPVAVYGSNIANSTTGATVDTSVLTSMSQLSTNPNTTYAMETDPNFTNRRSFLSSDYVINRLQLNPMRTQKRLGDGYYEQQLVMQAILRQTGKSRLQAGLTEEEQYRKLMDAGLTVMKSKSMTLGQGLTESEQQQLTEDVVMLVSQPVVLPNGKTETLLVPTLYLAPTTQRVEGAANMQAQSINLQVGTMHNRGSIVADDAITVHGNTIHNDNGLIKGRTTTVVADTDVRNTQGTIEGRDHTTVYAKNDVINEGGTIKQTDETGKLVVAADRDVINNGVKYEASNSKVVWDSANSRRETVTAVDQGQIAAKGDAVVTAGRDVAMQAGTVTSGKDATVAAGRQVTMKAMTENHELEEHRYDKGKSGGGHSQTTETHDVVNEATSVGSSVEGNNVTVSAKADVALSGSEILAADKAQVEGQNVKLDTASATSTANHVYKDKKKSLVKRERTDATGVAQVTAVTGSVVSGKDVAIKSGHDVTGQSAKLMGEKSVQVTAAGKVELGADKNVMKETSTYRHKTSGLMGSGIGFTIGTEKRNIDDTNREEETVRNTIASTKGNVNITANDTVHLTSTDVLSKTGTTIEGTAVTLDGNTDTQHMTHDDHYKKSGLTVALGGAIADSITNATRTIKQAGGRDDKRLAALELNEARKQLQDGYGAVDKAIKGVKLRDPKGNVLKDTKGHSKRGQKSIDDAVNLSVSIGSTSQKQGQTVDTATYKGGTIISDGDVHLTARDAKKNGITLTGESVSAESISLASASDINVEAGKNTIDVKNDYKSSGWSAGASISLTGGGLIDINASAHMARQNGDTHQESYVPTKIKAAELAQLKAKRDTNIIGSTVSGRKVVVDTGRNLHIQSLQDVDNFKEHSKSAGFSVSSKPTFKDPTGSINASVGRIDSKWKSVTEQAGIYAGEEGYDINVGNSITLEGALIKSNAPKTKNKLTTKSLEIKDIKNKAEYTYSNNGIGYNYYGSKKKLEAMKTNDKKGYDKIYNNIGLVPNLGVGSKGKASSTTQSAISDGILTVDGKEIDTKTINTNTENTLHQLDKIFDKKKIEERQELARLFSKNAFEQLHNWQPTTKDGKVTKSIAHGIIGELAARIAGNAPGSGFKATMTNEMLIGEIKKVAKNDPAVAQWLSAVVGGVVNKATGGNANAGAAVASHATKWNEALTWSPELSNILSAIASTGKTGYGVVKGASPVAIGLKFVGTPLVTGYGEPTTFDESEISNIPGSASYIGRITAIAETGDTLGTSVDESDFSRVYNGPWVKTETYPGTSLKVQLDYNLDSGFQPINVYHSPDGNTYQDNGKHDVINRRFFDGISIPGSTIYTGRFIGTDGTDNWVASQDKFNDSYIHIVNINSGKTAILPYTKGDISIIDDPTDSIIRNPNTGRLESIKTGLPVSVNVADQFKTKFNPISEPFESSSITVLEANKYQDKSKADTLLKDNIEKGIDKLNKKSPKPSNDDLAKIGIGVTVLDKAKNQIKEIFSSLKQLKNLPEGYKMIERKFIKMKNDSLGEQLRDEVGGSWRKVYEEGIDINGRRIKIHYFMNDAGEIFNPKIKQIDGLKNLDIPLR